MDQAAAEKLATEFQIEFADVMGNLGKVKSNLCPYYSHLICPLPPFEVLILILFRFYSSAIIRNRLESPHSKYYALKSEGLSRAASRASSRTI